MMNYKKEPYFVRIDEYDNKKYFGFLTAGFNPEIIVSTNELGKEFYNFDMEKIPLNSVVLKISNDDKDKFFKTLNTLGKTWGGGYVIHAQQLIVWKQLGYLQKL